MDSKSQEYLDNLLKKSPEELNEVEKVFLMARRSYLKSSQLEEYKSVLEPKPPKVETVKKNAKKEK